MKYILH